MLLNIYQKYAKVYLAESKDLLKQSFQIFHGKNMSPPLLLQPPVKFSSVENYKGIMYSVFELPSFPREILTQELPGSPLPASMGERELEMWERWWRPELPSLGSGVIKLARQHAAGHRAWRGRVPSSPKETPFPDWPALPTSRNLEITETQKWLNRVPMLNC